MIIEPHPLLDARVFLSRFAEPVGTLAAPSDIRALLSLTAPAPLQSDDAVREAVRVLLRHGGFKPSGRSKPASEYLLRAVRDGVLASINPAVDVCNIVSLHSGLPISVVDAVRAQAPFRIGIAPPGASYVFNVSGQVIDLEGLLCLFDATGPCANAIKDAQRTKTDANTTQTMSVIWGTRALPERAAQAETWYRALIHALGATTEEIAQQECARETCKP